MMIIKLLLCPLFCSLNFNLLFAGVPEIKSQSPTDTTSPKIAGQVYRTEDGNAFLYTRPRPFGFITHIPGDAASIAKAPFKKNAIKPLIIVAGSTGLLLIADQSISNTAQHFFRQIHIHPEEDYKNIVDMPLGNKSVSILKAPSNINTALYQVGQGFPSLLIGAGLFAYGKIHHDYRSLNTASELAETFIVMGVGTQMLKRISGRQSPSDATRRGGAWHWFPPFRSFQQHTPKYDAFPSGHLATIMSTVTVLADNYPDNHWIQPVGYSVTGLLAMAMINNRVHWASDYPLGLALGYLCAKVVVRNNRKIIRNDTSAVAHVKINYSCAYFNKVLMPQVIMSF